MRMRCSRINLILVRIEVDLVPLYISHYIEYRVALNRINRNLAVLHLKIL
jgi:hypothetical protein